MAITPGAISSQGTTFKKGASPNIGFINSIDGLDIKANTLDTTALDNTAGYKTFIGGFKEVNEVSISGWFDYTTHSGFMTDLQAGTQATYTIQFPPNVGGVTGAKWTFDAIVVNFKTKAGVDAVVTFDAQLKVSGSPTLVAGT